MLSAHAQSVAVEPLAPLSFPRVRGGLLVAANPLSEALGYYNACPLRCSIEEQFDLAEESYTVECVLCRELSTLNFFTDQS